MLMVYIKNFIKLMAASIVGRCFWNYRLYKKYAGDQNKYGALKLVPKGRFAIVIQGPNIFDDEFTIETIKLYRHNFPDAILILSTWSVSADMIEELKKHDVHVVQNQRPTNPGISNINLQIITSGAGVVAARELGAQFVLKTRTDQRIYHPSLEAYLFNILKHYPLLPDVPGQMKRLVGISLGTFKYRLYGVSDMFLYGHIDDMVRYWNIPLDARIDSTEKRDNAGDNTWRTFSAWRICEVYLCTEFLKSIGRDITFTLADSFQVFRDHFVVIDQAAIKLYWHKYTLNADRYAGLGFFDPELSFNDWLVLYHSIDNVIIDETILDQPISKTE
jgi:hypothetical protein